MEKVKIKSKNPNAFGLTVILPIDGETKISTNGELEVSQECADILLANPNSYEPLEVEKEKVDKKAKVEAKKTKAKEEEDESEEDESEEEEEEEDDSSEDADTEEGVKLTKKDLEGMELDDIQEIVKASGLSKASYAKVLKDKKKLIAFVLKNI